MWLQLLCMAGVRQGLRAGGRQCSPAALVSQRVITLCHSKPPPCCLPLSPLPPALAPRPTHPLPCPLPPHPVQRHVLVSNHISTADLLVLFQRPQRYVHLITTALPAKVYACQHLPAILQPADKRTYLSIAEQTAQQQQQQDQGLRLQTSSSSSGEAGPSLHSLHATPVDHLQHQQHHSSMQEQHAHANGGISSSSSSSRQTGQASQLQPQQDPQQPSVHLFPEGGMTNGKGEHLVMTALELWTRQSSLHPNMCRHGVCVPCCTSQRNSSAHVLSSYTVVYTCTSEAPPLPLALSAASAALGLVLLQA